MQIMNPAEPGLTMKDENGILDHPNGHLRTPLSTELKDIDEHDTYADADDFNGTEKETKDMVHLSRVHTEVPHTDSSIFTDKDVLVSDLPELIICYKDSTFHAVRDICVDEGVPAENKCLTENVMDGHSTLPSDNYAHKDVTDKAETDILYADAFKSSLHKDLRTKAVVDSDKGEVDANKDTGHDKDGAGIEFSPESYKNQDNAGVLSPEILTHGGEEKCNAVEKSTEIVCDSLRSGENHAVVDSDKGEVDANKDTDHDKDGAGIEFSPESYKDQDNAGVLSPGILTHGGEEKCNAVEKSTEIVCDSLHSGENRRRDISLECLLESSRCDETDCSQWSEEISGVQGTLTTEELNKSKCVDNPLYSGELESETITLDIDSSKVVPSNGDEIDNNAIGQELKSEDKINNDNGTSGSHLVVNSQIKRGEGESSFSYTGPPPESVPNSGHVPFSGSISLRSDSSTTSTRSFAFPVLPNEWNSSPVRMKKADRRQLRKNRGCFLCCRF